MGIITASPPLRISRLPTLRQLRNSHSTTKSLNMPLVVPGIQSEGGDGIQAWTTKLMGKTLGDDHSETCFAKQDLPKEHRVLQPDTMCTQDYKPDRLNVHVDEAGTVKDVKFG